MDIRDFLSDKGLLTSLSKEFELLKKTGENVDFDAWIQVRLKEAATKRHTNQNQAETSRQPLQALRVNDSTQPTLHFNKPPSKPRSEHAAPPLPSGLHSLAGEGKVDVPAPFQFISIDPSPPHPHSTEPMPRPAIQTTAVLAAASERERRLALSAALARQQIALDGLGRGGEVGPDGKKQGELKSSEYVHVLNLVKHLAEQNEKIASSLRMVQQSAAGYNNREQAQARPTHNSPGHSKPNEGERAMAGRRKEAPHVAEPWFVAAARGNKSPSRAKKVMLDPSTDKERDRRRKKEKLKASLKLLLGGGEGGAKEESATERMILALKKMVVARRGEGTKEEPEVNPGPSTLPQHQQQQQEAINPPPLRPQTIDPSLIIAPPRQVQEDQVASMEDQVHQIILADKEKKTEDERLKRIDALEERMSLLLTQLEQNQAAPPPSANSTSQARETAPAMVEEPQLGLSEMQELLLALEHMEDKEAQIRQRWFESQAQGSGLFDPSEATNGPGPKPIVLVDGNPRGSATVHSTLAISPQHLNPQHLKGATTGVDPLISDKKLERVVEGRERFLRHQRVVDGDLVASGMPVAGPTCVVEDLVDSLIDEMLLEEAGRMMELCDDVGDELYEEEFVDT